MSSLKRDSVIFHYEWVIICFLQWCNGTPWYSDWTLGVLPSLQISPRVRRASSPNPSTVLVSINSFVPIGLLFIKYYQTCCHNTMTCSTPVINCILLINRKQIFPDTRYVGGFGTAPQARVPTRPGGTVFGGHNWGRGQTLGGNWTNEHYFMINIRSVFMIHVLPWMPILVLKVQLRFSTGQVLISQLA